MAVYCFGRNINIDQETSFHRPPYAILIAAGWTLRSWPPGMVMMAMAMVLMATMIRMSMSALGSAATKTTTSPRLSPLMGVLNEFPARAELIQPQDSG